MEPLAKQLQVPLVSYSEWLTALERFAGRFDVDRMRENPALRILDFFQSAELKSDREPLGIVYLDTQKSQRVAPALGLPELTSEWATKWLDHWKRSGFISSSVQR